MPLVLVGYGSYGFRYVDKDGQEHFVTVRQGQDVEQLGLNDLALEQLGELTVEVLGEKRPVFVKMDDPGRLQSSHYRAGKISLDTMKEAASDYPGLPLEGAKETAHPDKAEDLTPATDEKPLGAEGGEPDGDDATDVTPDDHPDSDEPAEEKKVEEAKEAEEAKAAKADEPKKAGKKAEGKKSAK